MLLRRLTGCLLTLLTLNLNLLGADFACAKHPASESGMKHGGTEHNMVMGATAVSDAEHASHASNATTHEMASHEAMAHGAPSAGNAARQVSNSAPPCDVPVQPNCCKALASCNVVFSASNELDVAGTLNLPELIAPDAMTAPPSERAAPEPPPPKA